MALKAGSIQDFANSMAEAMETAFKNEWHAAMGKDADVPVMNNQAHLMFVAVAQGVVNYLKEHHADFNITATQTSPGVYTGTVSKID